MAEAQTNENSLDYKLLRYCLANVVLVVYCIQVVGLLE